MRQFVSFVLVVCFLMPAVASAVGSKDVQYIGGTAPGMVEKMEGSFSTTSEDRAVFTVKKKPNRTLEIPYSAITSLEYGQNAGRRVAMAVLVSPFALFSKKRNHFLTVSYTDAQGKEQAAVFELGKDIVRTTLKVLEVRSGKGIEYQDDDARKSGVGGQ
jgi:hypothetical protein